MSMLLKHWVAQKKKRKKEAIIQPQSIITSNHSQYN